jgi:hypothetical protein
VRGAVHALGDAMPVTLRVAAVTVRGVPVKACLPWPRRPAARRGRHVFDLQLFCGDDGQVYRAGTLDRVASFSQGGATGTDDEDFIAAFAART